MNTDGRNGGILRRVYTAIMISAGGLSGPATAAAVTIVGDSIGVGLSLASGAPSLAHNSVAIRGGDTLLQMSKLSRGDVAVVSLGTNDAVGNIAATNKAIDRLVEGLEKSGLRIFWMGPPCVLKKWNANVILLDRILRERLQSTAITYVSVSDQSICNQELRAADGVHFNMRGYATLWSRVAQIAKLPDKFKKEHDATPTKKVRTKSVKPDEEPDAANSKRRKKERAQRKVNE